MFKNDKSSWGGSGKKEKKVKSAPKKSEDKKMFGGSFFGSSSSFGADSSFGKDSDKKPLFNKEKTKKSSFGKESGGKSLFGKEKNERSAFGDSKDGEKASFFKRLKWWHILLAVFGVVIITLGIIAAVLIGKVNDIISGGGLDNGEDIPETEGIIMSVGTFIPDNIQEYILCEYTEYFSNSTVRLLQREGDIRHNYQPYWVFISDDGTPLYNFSGAFSGNSTPEEVKQELFSQMSVFGYTEERLANCAMHLYQPVSFTRVVISSVSIATDGAVSIKYSAGAVDGEMSEEYTLAGTYVKTENDFAFTYTELPEDENLLRVAETLLGSAKYDYYAQYGQWVNKLTFGDYELYLTEDDSADDDTTDDDVVNDGTTDDDVVNDDNVNDDSSNDDSSSDDSSDNTL